MRYYIVNIFFIPLIISSFIANGQNTNSDFKLEILERICTSSIEQLDNYADDRLNAGPHQYTTTHRGEGIVWNELGETIILIPFDNKIYVETPDLMYIEELKNDLKAEFLFCKNEIYKDGSTWENYCNNYYTTSIRKGKNKAGKYEINVSLNKKIYVEVVNGTTNHLFIGPYSRFTKIYVKAGDVIYFKAGGIIYPNLNKNLGGISPTGISLRPEDYSKFCISPDFKYCSLLVSLEGFDGYFPISDYPVIKFSKAGYLKFTINDIYPNDNDGHFEIIYDINKPIDPDEKFKLEN